MLLQTFVFNTGNLLNEQVVIVFGAGVLPNKTPSLVLQERLDKTVEIYNQGRANYVFVTGDNRESHYNEPLAMKNYLIKKGIPAEKIKEDFGGRRTADSCYRGANFFGIRKAILITQSFHLPRAYFLCTSKGMQVEAVSAENDSFSTTFFGLIREIPASWVALKDAVYYTPGVGSDGTEENLSGG